MSKNKKLNSAKTGYIERLVDTSKLSKDLDKYLKFNFKYYSSSDKASQSFEDWEKNKILSDLNNKLCDFSSLTVKELEDMDKLAIYGKFPSNSDFKEPKCFEGLNVKWARLRLTGRRRLIGVFIPGDDSTMREVFYVVFLDENHKFYKVKQ